MCSICGCRFTTPLFVILGDRDDLIQYPTGVFLLAPYWHIQSISNHLATISKADVLTSKFGDLWGTITFLEGYGGHGGRGWAHSIARTWVPVSSPLTHMVYLLPFLILSYLAGSKSVSACCPYDVNTMTNTALEATASLSGNDWPVHSLMLSLFIDLHGILLFPVWWTS